MSTRLHSLAEHSEPYLPVQQQTTSALKLTSWYWSGLLLRVVSMPNSFLLRENPTMSDHLWSTASHSVTSHHYVKNVIHYPHQGNFLSIVCNFCPLTRQLQKLLMISDEFLPRDAMRKRSLCCDPLSVCPSVHHVRAFYPDCCRYCQTSLSAR